MKLRLLFLALAGCAAGLSIYGQTTRYSSATVDAKDQLHLVLTSGRAVHAPLLKDQSGFQDARISKDQTVVGWVALYPNPDEIRAWDPVAGELVLYSAGHIVRTFRTEQIFWSWKFAANKHDVAYCTGPMHGGANQCELHSGVTGRLLGTWDPRSKRAAPKWAEGLDY